jgi:hypothetical protein
MDIKHSASRTFQHVLHRVLPVGFLLFFAGMSCRGVSFAPQAPRVLHKGDKLNGMLITTGGANAHPLDWYCTFDIADTASTSVDCQVPPLSRLAIGHMINVMDWEMRDPNGSNPSWQVSLDGYRLDLDSFEIQSPNEPQLLDAYISFHEGINPEKTWDVVLIHPTFGPHTLHGTARSNSTMYNWVVNFTIDAPDSLEVGDRPPEQIPSWQEVWGRDGKGCQPYKTIFSPVLRRADLINQWCSSLKFRRALWTQSL